MKLTYAINGRRFTEPALRATLGKARIEEIKRHVLYLSRNDSTVAMDWPLQGRDVLRISFKP